MSETLAEQQCQCILRSKYSDSLVKEIEEMKEKGMWDTLTPGSQEIIQSDIDVGRCPKPVDPSTGEAMLCKDCWENDHHKEANMVPKRLPKREAVYGSSA